MWYHPCSWRSTSNRKETATSICNNFEGDFLGTVLSGVWPPKLHSRWAVYVRKKYNRNSEQIREPGAEVRREWLGQGSMKTTWWNYSTWNDHRDLRVINSDRTKHTHTQGVQAVEHKCFNCLKWDLLLRDYLQFKAHCFMCPVHDPLGDIKLWRISPEAM